MPWIITRLGCSARVPSTACLLLTISAITVTTSIDLTVPSVDNTRVVALFCGCTHGESRSLSTTWSPVMRSTRGSLRQVTVLVQVAMPPQRSQCEGQSARVNTTDAARVVSWMLPISRVNTPSWFVARKQRWPQTQSMEGMGQEVPWYPLTRASLPVVTFSARFLVGTGDVVTGDSALPTALAPRRDRCGL